MPSNRLLIARTAFIAGVLAALWLGAGLLDIVPLLHLGGSYGTLRLHTAITIGCLLISAWGYWDS